jgi:uncharacterized secreted protein with C-terminal beta-propeller domain
LLNQYAMSEWNGYLRVATTATGTTGPGSTASAVYVLASNSGTLTQVGSVGGLGAGERIYAVRFVGPVGYVVTFRQTDPLYTVDLSNPAAPTVRGTLKIPGYSAYLHPVDGTHLIGVGRVGNALQVSLFDVSNLDNPTRLANYAAPGAYSQAEFDPHAFLYWPASGLLVLPLQSPYGLAVPTGTGTTATTKPTPYSPMSGALVLHVDGSTITQLGFLQHPATDGYAGPITRSIFIDGVLWTVSGAGLMASDASSLARLAFLPLG